MRTLETKQTEGTSRDKDGTSSHSSPVEEGITKGLQVPPETRHGIRPRIRATA
jgi:hypothetical protein